MSILSVSRAAALCALSFGLSSSALAQTLTPPSGQEYEYDMRGRLTRIVYQDCSYIDFDYDLHGNRRNRVVALGNLQSGVCIDNNAPVAVDDTFIVYGGEVESIDLFLNDSDPDGHTLTLISVEDPNDALKVPFSGPSTSGQLIVRVDGENQALTYTVTDGYGGLSTATVNFTVRIFVPGAIYGTEGNDTINGTAGADTIIAEGGNDIIYASAGSDQFDGGEGEDRVDYLSSATAVVIDLLTGATSGGDAVGDSYVDIENLRGSNHNDTLTGDNGPNKIWGRDGADTLIGGNGNDNLYGENGNDSLYGGSGNNWMRGQAGNDSFYLSANATGASSGEGGDDIFYMAGTTGNRTTQRGGYDQFDNGNDTVSYQLVGRGIQLDMSYRPTSWDTHSDAYYQDPATRHYRAYDVAGGSTYIDSYTSQIDNVTGTAFNDDITGDSAANILTGLAGDDILDGAGGSDTAHYAGAQSAYAITVHANGSATVSGNGEGTDTLTNIETLYFAGDASTRAVVQTAPSITSPASVNFAENGTGTALAVTATDAEGDTLTYALVGGADQGRFSINSSSGALNFASSPNFEVPTDTGTNNTYAVDVQVSDGVRTDQQSVLITVTNINDSAPVISTSSSSTRSEGNYVNVHTISANDADQDTVTYSIIGGADQAKFTINASTGQLGLVSAPNYESPTDSNGDNNYQATLRASDGTFVDDQPFTLTISNINEPHTYPLPGSMTVSENTGGVFNTTTANDPENASITYSVIGGADASRFNINSSSGALSFATAPNYESPTDSGANNVYNVTLRASDGAFNVDASTAVTVINVNDVSPSWTSSTTDSVAENTTSTFYNATSTDADGASATYSIQGGADASKFAITSAGALRFISAPNFESPTDSGANNSYVVTLRANDGGGNTSDRTVTVAVTNTNDIAPSWTSSTTDSVAENTSGTFYTATTNDADGPARTYSIVGGADASRFSINSSSGALSFVSAPNYESPNDSGTNNVYNVTLRASDGSHNVDRAVAVTVTNTNDVAPSWTSSTTDSVAENTTSTFYNAATNDADGPARTYSIVGGNDAARFSITSAGALRFVSGPNFESPTDNGSNNVYNVTLRASDGVHNVNRGVAVTVTNVNDVAPSWASSTTDSVAENSTGTFYTASATDADSGSLTYSINGGVDASKFSINSSSGALSFNASPDFENPTDSGSNNVYNVTLRASDGSLTTNRNLAVTVTNVTENTGPTAADDDWMVQAGGTVTIPVLFNDSDPDGDTLTITSINGSLSKGYASIVSGSTIRYTAYSFASGLEIFTYTISDGNGHTATGTVEVTVASGGGGGFPF